MSLLTNTYDVHKGEFETAGDASASIKRKLKQLGVDSAILRRVAVASYEAELNRLRRAMYDWGVRIGDPKLVRNLRPWAEPRN